MTTKYYCWKYTPDLIYDFQPHRIFLTFVEVILLESNVSIPTSSEEQILQILYPAGVSLDGAPGPAVSSALC